MKREGTPSVAPRDQPDAERFSRQLTDLLAEMVRTEARAVPEQWSGMAPGARLGRFELVRELGRGGFGVVWEARDLELGRAVAIKLIRPGARVAAHGSEWLRREAVAVARLNHPGIVTLFDVGQGPGGLYLVLELLRGETLAERLRRGPLSRDEVLRVGAGVARALEHAHAAGVTHRDLTPGNVHLGQDGRVKVLDFGLSSLLGRTAASSGGTGPYMAPEQWRGEPGDGRTDLFALGAILHQALCGRPPYRAEGEDREVLQPGPTPELPLGAAQPALRGLVRRLVERDPARRPGSAAQVRQTLERLRRWHGRVGVRAGAGLLLLAALAALGWAAWWRLRPEPLSTVPGAEERYREAMDCWLRLSAGGGGGARCAEGFRAALALDPGLPQAHLRLAMALAIPGHEREKWAPHLEAALAAAPRMSPRDAELARALDARLAGRVDEARRQYQALLDEDPADLDALDGAAALAVQRDDWEGVEPLVRKQLALGRNSADLRDTLVESLGRRARLDQVRAELERLWPLRTSAELAPVVVNATAWCGEPGRGIEAAQDAVAANGERSLLTLATAFSSAGRFAEVEATWRRYLAQHPELAASAPLATSIAAQGRVREAQRALDEAAAARGAAPNWNLQEALISAASWDARQVRRPAEQCAEVDPVYCVMLALPLRLLGDDAAADRVAAAIPPGTITALEDQALREWRAGDMDRALATLAVAEAKDVWPVEGLPPAWLTAVVASSAGDHRAALAAVKRYQRLPPRGYHRAWTWPRALLVQARAEAALGRPDEARATLSRLLSLWAKADPDLPGLGEARALRATLRP
ncbi:MAG: protein kinase [Anaeromyxobacter sp.]